MKIRNRMRNLVRAFILQQNQNESRAGARHSAHKTKRAARTGAAVLAAALALSGLLTACGKDATPQAQTQVAASSTSNTQGGKTAQQPTENALKTVLQGEEMARGGESGFYTLESPHFTDKRNLMFYDYNTLQQRYVCADTACAHDNPACTSYLDSGIGGVSCFTVGDKLYLLYVTYPEEGKTKSEWTAAIVQRNLDGTQPQVLAQADKFGAFQQLVFTDGASLYLQYNESGQPGEPGDAIARIDLVSGEIKCIPWDTNNTMVCTAQGREIFSLRRGGTSIAPPMTLCATNVDTGETRTLHTWPENTYGYFGAPVNDGKLYYANLQTGAIMAYDLAANTEAPVTDTLAQYGQPYERNYAAEGFSAEDAAAMQEQSPMEYPAAMWGGQILGDWMRITCDNLETPRCFAYNLQTAELREVTLTDYWNGREHSLQVHALSPRGLVVTQETRPLKVNTSENGKPGTYDSAYWVYALMDMEDYLASSPNFRTIQPVEYGDENAKGGGA